MSDLNQSLADKANALKEQAAEKLGELKEKAAELTDNIREKAEGAWSQVNSPETKEKLDQLKKPGDRKAGAGGRKNT